MSNGGNQARKHSSEQMLEKRFVFKCRVSHWYDEQAIGAVTPIAAIASSARTNHRSFLLVWRDLRCTDAIFWNWLHHSFCLVLNLMVNRMGKHFSPMSHDMTYREKYSTFIQSSMDPSWSKCSFELHRIVVFATITSFNYFASDYLLITKVTSLTETLAQAWTGLGQQSEESNSVRDLGSEDSICFSTFLSACGSLR